MKMSKKSNGKLLQDILIELATLKERMKNCIDQNAIDHKEIKDKLDEIENISGKEMKDVETRLRKLEDKELQLSTTWKIIISLALAIPTIFTIINTIKAWYHL